MADDQLLTDQLNHDGRRRLLRAIWPTPTGQQPPLVGDFESFVLVVEEYLSVFRSADYNFENYGRLYQVINYIRNNIAMTRQELVDNTLLFFPQPSPQVLRNQPRTVELAVRIGLMLGFDGSGFDDPDAGGEPENHWLNHRSLSECIEPPSFPPPPVAPDRMFSPFFNFMDMERFGDFDIKPTKNLMNHLFVAKFRNRKFRTTVFVFHHAKVLERLRPPFPAHDLQIAALARETAETLGLLLPAHCTKWWNKKVDRSLVGQDPNSWIRHRWDRSAGCQPPPSPHVEHYEFWRARLLLLEKEFEEASPRSYLALWRDKRRGREWRTFWFAVAAVIFAILALIVSAIGTGFTGKTTFQDGSGGASPAGQSAGSTTGCVALTVHNTFMADYCCSGSTVVASNYTAASLATLPESGAGRSESARTLVSSAVDPAIATVIQTITTTVTTTC